MGVFKPLILKVQRLTSKGQTLLKIEGIEGIISNIVKGDNLENS
jgi:hypothetical protein